MHWMNIPIVHNWEFCSDEYMNLLLLGWSTGARFTGYFFVAGYLEFSFLDSEIGLLLYLWWGNKHTGDNRNWQWWINLRQKKNPTFNLR